MAGIFAGLEVQLLVLKQEAPSERMAESSPRSWSWAIFLGRYSGGRSPSRLPSLVQGKPFVVQGKQGKQAPPLRPEVVIANGLR